MTWKIVNWDKVQTESIGEDDYDDIGGSSFRLPWWWNEDSKPCSCDCDIKCTHQAVGYSDYLYYEVECLKCRHTWCAYIEG